MKQTLIELVAQWDNSHATRWVVLFLMVAGLTCWVIWWWGHHKGGGR